MSAFAQRALIVTVPYPLWPFGPSPPDRGSRPPVPRLRGRVTLVRKLFPAGKSKTCFCPTLGPLGPIAIQI